MFSMLPIVPIAIVIVAFYIFSSIKILSEYERAVIFRLGRLLSEGKGPGIILVFQPFDLSLIHISCRFPVRPDPAYGSSIWPTAVRWCRPEWLVLHCHLRRAIPRALAPQARSATSFDLSLIHI